MPRPILSSTASTTFPRRNLPRPEWYDEMHVAATSGAEPNDFPAGRNDELGDTAVPQELAYCFLQASRLQFGAFETLTSDDPTYREKLAKMVMMTGKRILVLLRLWSALGVAVQAAPRRSGQDDVKWSQSNVSCDCLRVSLSRRFVRRDLLDLRRERVFGRFEIEACLNVHPERSAGLEELAEPQRGVGRNGLFFACNAFDPGTRYVQRGRDRVGCQLKRKRRNSSRRISPE